MMARLSAFVIWALVAAALVFWGMRLFMRADPVPPNAVVVGESTNARGDLSRLFGAEPVAQVAAPPAASTRFKLLGVMAAKASPQGMTPGVALISIDGKPARAFTAGARIEDRLVLQNVSLRTASIGAEQGPTSFVLELPPLPPPATGVLPTPAFESPSGAPPMQPPQGVPPEAQPQQQLPPPVSPRPMPGRVNPNNAR